jgi:glycogen debranching enzyme
MLNIISLYRRGTGLGIFVDSRGLITSKAPGIGTSWMDANCNGWVVTPRQGKPVELNALWYNALCTLATWKRKAGRDEVADDLAAQARLTKTSFNATFWNETAGCCFDVVDEHGRDPSIRPNQLLAMTLPHPVLAGEFHEPVLRKVQERLLTPYGVRTLAPTDPGYQPRYEGNVIARDRAYHNGTAYPHLLGHYARALLRVEGRNAATYGQIRKLLSPCLDRLVETGQLCELFDGDAPHRPGGAFASARAVGELLRCYFEDVMAMEPAASKPAPTSSPTGIPQVV